MGFFFFFFLVGKALFSSQNVNQNIKKLDYNAHPQ